MGGATPSKPICDNLCRARREMQRKYNNYIDGNNKLKKWKNTQWNSQYQYFMAKLGPPWYNNFQRELLNQYKEQQNAHFFPLKNYSQTLNDLTKSQSEVLKLLNEKTRILQRTAGKLKKIIKSGETNVSKWDRDASYHLNDYNKKKKLFENCIKLIIFLAIVLLIVFLLNKFSSSNSVEGIGNNIV